MSTPMTESQPRIQPIRSAGGFLTGIGDVWRAWHYLLVHPELWIWAMIPFVLNVLIFTGLSWGAWHWSGAWIDQFMMSQTGWWWEVLGWLMRVLFWIMMALIVIFAFVPLATLVAAPFNDILSEKVERRYAHARVEIPFSLRAIMHSLWDGLKGSALLALKTMGLLLLVLPLYLLPPPLQLLGPLCSALITIRYLSLEHTAYSMDRRYYGFRQREEWLRRNRARTMGMGTMAFLVMTVPLVNALFIPVAAVAGTLLFCDTELDARPGE